METSNNSDARRPLGSSPATAPLGSGGAASEGKSDTVTAGQFAEQLKPYVDDALAAVRDASQQLREQALRVSDKANAYARDEPWKALLIAAAAGALVVGLVALLARSDD